jgi:hypothetical protein
MPIKYPGMHAWEFRCVADHPSRDRKDIIEKKRITEETEAKLRSALDAFTNAWQ